MLANFQAMFEGAPEALLAVDKNTLRIVAASDGALLFTGLRRDRFQKQTLHDILAPQDLSKITSLAESQACSELDGCSILTAEGLTLESDLRIEPLISASLIMISIRDASARGRFQEQLRQAQKMEALGMLSGGIAHDFNNLLTIIAGYSQMLIASPHMTLERDRVAIEQVLKASERAADLTAQLLAFSRRQSLQPKTLEINAVVDQTAAMLGRLIGEHIEVRIHKAPDAGRIHADAGQMQQVLMNLAINSRDAMPRGGTVAINTSNIELGEAYAARHMGTKPGSYVMLEVSDTGTGMDAATRDRVFEPFFTTKPPGQGTGLGLSTVYGLVRRWGGSVDLHTEPGQGTTFRVYLPRVEEAIAVERAEPAEARGGHETILLVEDEEGVRRMVHMALERRGYRVLVAAGGPEALDLARRHEGRIDLLITDIVMPQMDGGEFAALLRLERPSTRLLFISGYAGDVFHNNSAFEGDVPFLQKPFAPALLTSRVREILDAGDAGETANGAGRR